MSAGLTVISGGVDVPVRRRRQVGWCQHRCNTIQPSRRVTCDDCGAEVDPVDVLQMLADDWQRYVDVHDRAARDARAARERLREAERVERNAKARIRRLEKQFPPYLTVPQIDWLKRFIAHHRPSRVVLDGLVAALDAMREEINPSAESAAGEGKQS